MKKRRKIRFYHFLPFTTLAIIPTSCAQALLEQVTPVLIDGSNGVLSGVINSLAPFLLP